MNEEPIVHVERDREGGGVGLGVDRWGSPVVDPTRNVLDLVNAAVRRQDDLRTAEARHLRKEIRRAANYQHRLSALESKYRDRLFKAEQKRVDAIRATDTANAAADREKAAAQAAVLATQVSASAETLRLLVQQTAQTIATQFSQTTDRFTERLTAIEKTQNQSQGRGGGMSQIVAWIFGAVGLVALLFTIFNQSR